MILENNFCINDNDFVIQRMLSTDWFEITKHQYTNIIFENIKFDNFTPIQSSSFHTAYRFII